MRHLAVLLLLTTSAHAQRPSTSASAEADTLFDQGRALLQAGKIAEACGAFDASQKLSPAISTLFNQANCREQNHQYATAYGLFREADRQTRAPLDEATQKLNRVATERWRALEARLSKLTIVAPAVPGLEIRRGDVVVDPATWGRALPVDGGAYKITATAPDHEAWTTTVVVETEAAMKIVTVPALTATPRREAAITPRAGATGPRSQRVPYIVGGAALVALGGGLAAELLARRDYRAAEREPDDFRQEDLWTGAKTKRYFAQGLAVAGLAAAGVATYLYIRNTRVEPLVEPGSAGVQLRGSF